MSSDQAGGGDASAGSQGGGGGGAGAREGGAGDAGSQGAGALTLDAITAALDQRLAARDKELDKRFKRMNDELGDRRHAGKRGDPKPPSKEGGARGERDDSANEERDERSHQDRDVMTRDEYRAQRAYDRELARLEDGGVDSEHLEWVEEKAEELPVEARAEFVKALAKGIEIGRKKQDDKDDDGDMRPGGRRREATKAGETRKPTRGGEPPAHRQTVQLPSSWDEYLEIAKKDPKRKAEIDKHPDFSAVELRNRSRGELAGKLYGNRRR